MHETWKKKAKIACVDEISALLRIVLEKRVVLVLVVLFAVLDQDLVSKIEEICTWVFRIFYFDLHSKPHVLKFE